MTGPPQETLFVVVKIPYGSMGMDDRGDFDVKVAEDLDPIVGKFGGTFELLDEHGVTEWVAKLVAKGLRA